MNTKAVYLTKEEADFIDEMADAYIDIKKENDIDGPSEFTKGKIASAEKIKLYLEKIFEVKK